MKYVYEFTNGRKVTKREFLNWFQKKFLYTLRKFEMVKRGDVIGYKSSKDFRGVVLEDLLKMFSQKTQIELVKLPNKKSTKIASPDTTGTESDKIIHSLFKGDLDKLDAEPIKGKKIKPLYLFLDKEVLLYAKLKGLKFSKPKNKEDKVSLFVDSLEKKHPEIKYSIVRGYLDLF